MKQYTDKFLKDDNWIINKIQRENMAQQIQWGRQTHSAFEWLTYTMEELGELATAISECEYRTGTKEAVVREAIQAATLALKIAEMFEKEEQNDKEKR